MGVRERAFWSAKVTHAQHVADLKAACLDCLDGARVKVRDLHMHRWTDAELEEVGEDGVKRGDRTILMTREAVVGEMRKRAMERGLTPTGPRAMEDIAHESRLRLIGEMAEETARERARFERGNDREVLFMWPAQELVRDEYREHPRDWGQRWQAAAESVGWEGVARNGEWIARKDSPIWIALSRFGQPFPPFDYNSGMGTRDVERDKAVELGLVEEGEEIANPGELFREQLGASVQGMGDTEREWLKRTIEEAQGGEVRFTPDGRVEWTPPAPEVPPPSPTEPPGPDAAAQVRLRQTRDNLVEQLRAKQAELEAAGREEEAAEREAQRREGEKRRVVEALKAEAGRRRGEKNGDVVVDVVADARQRFEREFSQRLGRATEKQKGPERRHMIERVLASTWTKADGRTASEAATEESSKAEIDRVVKGDAEIAVLPMTPGLSHGVVLDVQTTRHLITRRNGQRDRRIRDAKRRGDAAALKRAEGMLTGEEVIRLLPRNMKQGKVTFQETNEEQKRVFCDVDGPELHIGLSRNLPGRRKREDPVFFDLTAFPPDEEFAGTKRQRSRK